MRPTGSQYPIVPTGAVLREARIGAGTIGFLWPNLAAKETDIVTTANVIVILGAAQAPAGRCAVCGLYVRDGDGFVSTFRGRRIRLTGDGCLSKFTADPERFLAPDALSIGPEPQEAGPASEWAFFE